MTNPGYPLGYRLAHVSVLVADTAIAAAFYRDVLGLRVSTRRPVLDFPGAWFDIGECELHLIEQPSPDARTGRPAHAGRDRHIALHVDDLAALCARLDTARVPYTRSRSGRAAIFCRDPDGNGLEFIATKVSP